MGKGGRWANITLGLAWSEEWEEFFLEKITKNCTQMNSMSFTCFQVVKKFNYFQLKLLSSLPKRFLFQSKGKKKCESFIEGGDKISNKLL